MPLPIDPPDAELRRKICGHAPELDEESDLALFRALRTRR
jgi:hypothetical protein